MVFMVQNFLQDAKVFYGLQVIHQLMLGNPPRGMVSLPFKIEVQCQQQNFTVKDSNWEY